MRYLHSQELISKLLFGPNIDYEIGHSLLKILAFKSQASAFVKMGNLD